MNWIDKSVLLAIGLLAGLILCVPETHAVPNPFKKYQPDVVVTDPFIEMHTGPGRGYPVHYVAGQGDRVTLLKRKTDWFKVRLPRGDFNEKIGWVHVSQLQHTLDLDGQPLVVPKTGMEAFTTRRWELGLGGGTIDGAATINGSLTFNLVPQIGFQAEVAQILGEYSDGYTGSVSVFMRPFPQSRFSPFFNVGTGYLHVQPQTTIVQAQDLDDEIVHAGLGADIYISRKFMFRMEYRRHTVLTSRDDNEELNQWKAGFSFFF